MSLLDRIHSQVRQQANRKAKGHRHKDPALVRFAMNSFLLGGRQHYEILHANLGKGAFPATRTIEKKLNEYDILVPEGEIYLKSLLDVLQKRNLPKVVCISEDATAVVQKREYNKSTNSIIGSSGQLQENGFPDSSKFIVKTVGDITSHFDLFEIATVVMVVMAKPLGENSPAIPICSFGSNNKFNAGDVQRRVDTLENALSAAGVEVLSYSADGDSRELKAMRQRISLGIRHPKLFKGMTV